MQNEDSMGKEQDRDKIIQILADLMRENKFSVEYKVKKKPNGIRVICEVTQEQMDELLKR